jgi:hypothetical protein
MKVKAFLLAKSGARHNEDVVSGVGSSPSWFRKCERFCLFAGVDMA